MMASSVRSALLLLVVLSVALQWASAEGPDAAKYKERLAKCKDEKCKYYARLDVYLACTKEEEACAYEAGQDGCMKKTVDCIQKVIGTA